MEPTPDTPPTQTSAPQFQKFPIAQIKTSRSQARRNFDEAGIQSLAETMKLNGQITPINVRLLPDGTAELVAGERRLRAAKLLGWTELDAVVQSAVSDQDAAIKGLLENLQREGLSAIETAQGYKTLSGPPYDLNQSQIARMVGKEQSLVNKYFGISKLCTHPGGMNMFIPLLGNFIPAPG